MKIGYVRVSTVEQNEGRQMEMMEQHGIEKIFMEKCSGRTTNRPKLQELLEFVREGDVVYIESFSRLARSTQDLLGMVDYFKQKGVQLISFKESLDTTAPAGKLMLTVIAAIAEFERDCLLERQREGIALAKRQGKYKGRKRIEYPPNWEEVYRLWKQRGITGVEAMRRTGLKNTTFYKMIKNWEEEQSQKKNSSA